MDEFEPNAREKYSSFGAALNAIEGVAISDETKK